MLKTSKSAETKKHILDTAVNAASMHGLSHLTLGALSESAGLSKSGLYAHFGSIESLRQSVITEVIERFEEAVVRPVLLVPRGVKRIEAILDAWIAWSHSDNCPGGCPIAAAGFEYDHPDTGIRDQLVLQFERWIKFIEREARHVYCGLSPKEVASLVLSLYLGQHLESHLMDRDKAIKRSRRLLSTALRQDALRDE